MIFEKLRKWPLVRQIVEGGDGTGPEAMSDRTRALRSRVAGADVTASVCPYCGVGCGQLIFHRDGKLLAIEGDPRSPISEGDLCPKGSASYELLTHSRRETTVKYRAPFAASWRELPLEQAMDMVADRVWQTRDGTFEQTREGKPLMQCRSIAHLGGATLDNEENYVIKKLFTGGLGMVAVSNQARI